MTTNKVAVISREWPLNMLNALAELLTEKLRDEGIGKIEAASLVIDRNHGRAIVDLIGVEGEDEVVVCLMSGRDGLTEAVNSWLVENAIIEFKVEIVRSEEVIYILVAGRRA